MFSILFCRDAILNFVYLYTSLSSLWTGVILNRIENHSFLLWKK